ncbi:hypothetical protein [Streptomyces sp. H27-D2]|uniref:hypothetical protein n=1 Tax=Streptomyces sp. H27-D2 TaxID=3046304 RepID=UPI002DBE107D|nr:hypothetical protein [Streptomyces sp. H27-D2]MEC4016025.1 hypothetical protein [Streptomyces sp. H27-D2]
MTIRLLAGIAAAVAGLRTRIRQHAADRPHLAPAVESPAADTRPDTDRVELERLEALYRRPSAKGARP